LRKGESEEFFKGLFELEIAGQESPAFHSRAIKGRCRGAVSEQAIDKIPKLFKKTANNLIFF